MSSYGELLKKYIKDSGLSYRALSKKTENLGKKVSQAYISQIVSGDAPAPSEEITKVLANAINGDEMKLNWYAFLDKAPAEISDFWILFDDELIDATLKLNRAYPNFLSKPVEKVKGTPEFENYEKAFRKFVRKNLEFFKHIPIAEEKDRKLALDYVLQKDSKEEQNKQSSIVVPLLGYIAAGKPIFAEEHIEDKIEIPNMFNLREGETFALKVKGDSMIGSRIYDGDIVIVKIQPEVENGEIAVVNVNGNDATLKRVRKIDGKVILFPDNPKYKPIVINNERARIIGKVIQVIFEP